MPEVESCRVEVFLLVENVSKAPPSVVLPFVAIKSLLVAFFCLLKSLVFNMFMSTECISVREKTVKLDGPVKRLKSGFMLLLEGVAVAKDTPSFGRLDAPL